MEYRPGQLFYQQSAQRETLAPYMSSQFPALKFIRHGGEKWKRRQADTKVSEYENNIQAYDGGWL